ncbi:MAG: response regulator transcription factor [Candidatus Sericytochromatia bacterium]
MRKLLLIDDDQTLAMLLKALMAQHGFELAWADRPSTGRVMLADRPELLLLDVMMPEQNGFEVCRQLRAEGNRTPIIMLTARGADDDRINGLKLGADDYLAKPFNHLELIARVEAVLRRLPTHEPRGDKLDPDRRVLRIGGREVPLTTMEYRLMEAMAGHPGRAYSRTELMDLLDETGAIESFDRAIDSHVSRLRNKIEPSPKEPRHLLTVRGLGYRFQW